MIKYPKQTKQWKTKDGRKIRICDMEDGHLLNTMAYIRRGVAHVMDQKMEARAEWQPQGEMASEAWANEMADADNIEDSLPCIYRVMALDAKRRGLKTPWND